MSQLPLLPSGPPEPHLTVGPSLTQGEGLASHGQNSPPIGQKHRSSVHPQCHLGRMAQELPGNMENRRGTDPDCLRRKADFCWSDGEVKLLAQEGPHLMRAHCGREG